MTEPKWASSDAARAISEYFLEGERPTRIAAHAAVVQGILDSHRIPCQVCTKIREYVQQRADEYRKDFLKGSPTIQALNHEICLSIVLSKIDELMKGEPNPFAPCLLCATGVDPERGKVLPAAWTHIRGEYSWRHPLEADRMMSVPCTQPGYVSWCESMKHGGNVSLADAFSAGIAWQAKVSKELMAEDGKGLR